MTTISRRISGFAIALTLVAGAVAVTGCGSSNSSANAKSSTPASTPTPTTTAAKAATTPPAGGPVAVSLTEFKIKAPATLTAGKTTFAVTDNGKIRHQLTIIRTTKPASKVLAHGKSDDMPGRVGEIDSLAPGHSTTLKIKNLKPGHYALVCNLPGHYASGMYADLTVTQ